MEPKSGKGRFRSAGRWAGRPSVQEQKASKLWHQEVFSRDRFAKALLLLKGERGSNWVLDPPGQWSHRLRARVRSAWLSDIGWRRGGGWRRDHRRKIVDYPKDEEIHFLYGVRSSVLTLLSRDGAELLGIGADNSKRRLKWPLEPQKPQAPEAHIR